MDSNVIKHVSGSIRQMTGLWIWNIVSDIFAGERQFSIPLLICRHCWHLRLSSWQPLVPTSLALWRERKWSGFYWSKAHVLWNGIIQIPIKCVLFASVQLLNAFQTACPMTTWWRNQMETFSLLLALCAGNSTVNSPHKGQWRGALMFYLICA